MKSFIVRLSRILFGLGAVVFAFSLYFAFTLRDGSVALWFGCLIAFFIIMAAFNYLFLGQFQPWAMEVKKEEVE